MSISYRSDRARLLLHTKVSTLQWVRVPRNQLEVTMGTEDTSYERRHQMSRGSCYNPRISMQGKPCEKPQGLGFDNDTGNSVENQVPV